MHKKLTLAFFAPFAINGAGAWVLAFLLLYQQLRSQSRDPHMRKLHAHRLANLLHRKL